MKEKPCPIKIVFKTLYKIDSKGNFRVWNIDTNKNKIEITHGLEGGKLIKTVKTCHGKNIGRANETTNSQQAELEALALYNKQLDKGYTTTRVSPDIIRPMLAHPFEKAGKNIVYPCFVQPKYDGVRCIAIYDKEVKEYVLYSRLGKVFPAKLEHIRKALNSINKNIIWDGELYVEHDEMTFQELISVVKNKEYSAKQEKVKFYIFDIVDKSLNNEDRFLKIESFRDKIADPLVIVPTYICDNFEDIKLKHVRFIKSYEGTIIRNFQGKYSINHRSRDLIKYKDFVDKEYEIADFTEGKDKDAGTVIWVCKAKEGQKFNVRPRGTHQERSEWFKNGKKYIGKKLTVRYQELTDGEIPRFGVGIALRDYE